MFVEPVLGGLGAGLHLRWRSGFNKRH
jgi:hypothetical protein